MNNETLIDILENRKAGLMGFIAEDKKRFGDPFLGQHMRGRVAVEERWLDETERLIKALRKG